MKKTQTSDKLAFKAQTLRQLSAEMTPEQLAQVQGGQKTAEPSARSAPTVVCG